MLYEEARSRGHRNTNASCFLLHVEAKLLRRKKEMSVWVLSANIFFQTLVYTFVKPMVNNIVVLMICDQFNIYSIWVR